MNEDTRTRSRQVLDDTDELLRLSEVCKLKKTSEATERWLRHEGRAPYLWKSGRNLVAWKSEVLAHLAAEREADASRRESA